MAQDIVTDEYELDVDLLARIAVQKENKEAYDALPDNTRHVVDVALIIRDALACQPPPEYELNKYFPEFGIVWALGLPEIIEMHANKMPQAEMLYRISHIFDFRKKFYTKPLMGNASVNVFMQVDTHKYPDDEEPSEQSKPTVISRIDEDGMIYVE